MQHLDALQWLAYREAALHQRRMEHSQLRARAVGERDRIVAGLGDAEPFLIALAHGAITDDEALGKPVVNLLGVDGGDFKVHAVD